MGVLVSRRSLPPDAARSGPWLLAVVLVAAAACGGGGARPACLGGVDVDSCTPLYPAEFPIIYRQILAPTCAAGGVGCHGDGGRAGEVVFDTEAEAYDSLLGRGGHHPPRVVPGDAACSELVVRLDSTGHEWSMPPGSPLDARARCSIRRWIAAGAPAGPTTP